MDTMPPPPAEVRLQLRADGSLCLLPRGAHPRLERAFAVSAGRGMLDLLRFGAPAGASAALVWLRERARERMADYLRRLRRGEAPEAALQLPGADLARLLEGMPPLAGGELSAGMLGEWWASLGPALAELAARESCSAEEWLCRLGEGWQQLGSICFHLAENAGENAHEAPFAFLATFVHKVGQDGKARHLPLGHAAAALANDREALLGLLRPLRAAAEQNAFLRSIIQSQEVYKPCAWTARAALSFVEAIPVLEAVGIETRMVNLWKTQPPRVQLEVCVDMQGQGSKPDAAPSVNIHSLLFFSPRLVLGEHRLTEEEWQALLENDEGLVRFRGEWVRPDSERLQRLLESWRQATRMAHAGIPLLVGLRYLLGKRSEALPQLPPPAEDGLRLVAGAKLALALSNLHFGNEAPVLPAGLEKTLRAYQKEGVRFLANVTEAGFGACLADDMGLGKTLQVIAWLAHLHALGRLGEGQGAALIVAPASLLDNWQQELARFAPQLRVVTLHPYALSRQESDLLRSNPAWLMRRAHVALTTYGIATREEMLARGEEYPALVLDEAQAIKNAASQRTRAILRLRARRRVALSGTPVENSLAELRSLFEFLNPGLLGTEKEFNALVREMGSDYAPLRRLVRPFMLRRLKSDPALLPELPPKTEQPAYCLLTPEQARLYALEVESLRAVLAEPDPQTRLTLVLPILGRLKQICNHPAQYLGESYFDPALSGKFERLRHLAGRMSEAGEACLVFTQYRSMIRPLRDFLEEIFGAPGLELHGGTPIPERQRLVQAFQAPGGPPFIILSLKAAGTGLTLTRARHVIHFDRWWNPAVENQASDRAHRMGQKQPVIIHPLICTGTIEANIHTMLHRKTAMADALLSGGLEKLLLHLSPEELLSLMGR